MSHFNPGVENFIFGEQEVSKDVRIEKYQNGNPNITLEELSLRVSKDIASVEKNKKLRDQWTQTFASVIGTKATGGGRIMSNAGSGVGGTYINCFVQPVGDSIADDTDRFPGIYTALSKAAQTMRRGGGVGYDFSKIRPKWAQVNGTNSNASGPCSFISVYDKSCETVEASGLRRGAQMGVLKCTHPDIEEFVTMKQTPGVWKNFNVSIMVTDDFMRAVEKDADWQLVHEAEPSDMFKSTYEGTYQREDGLWVYKTVKAKKLYDTIMQSTYDFAEPGILFYDNINKVNNLRYIEVIDATNPCVTGDTLILTDKGYVRIDSVVGQKTFIWNGFAWSPVKPRVTGRNQEIIDFEFSDGTKLSCTPYHKFILPDGSRIEAKDLELGTRLCKFKLPVIQGHKTVDRKLSYTQGFYSGDGTRNSKKITIYEEKIKLIPHLALSSFTQVYTGRNNRVAGVLDFVPMAKDYVPETDYTVKTRLDWLAGLLDADGSSQDGALSIWSVDRNFLHKLKLMLNTLGVIPTISLGRKSGTREMPDGLGGLKEYECQDCWRLTISASHVAKLIELGLETHRVKIKCKPDREAKRFTVPTFKMKRTTLEDKVYCFTDPINNSGIFNGIMTANCGEQPLPAYGCCDLGAIMLTKFVKSTYAGRCFETNNAFEFDFEEFKKTVRIMVRFLDNVLDRTMWPLEEQKKEAMNKRRIGLGYSGLGNVLALLGYRYGSPESLAFVEQLGQVMANEAYLTSVVMAIEKGPFPLFKADDYLEEGTFASKLPENIKNEIRQHGIRNSHLLTVAPTGTISLAFMDNCSNGLEPPFDWFYTRKKRMDDGSTKEYMVIDAGIRMYLQEMSKYAIVDVPTYYPDSHEPATKPVDVANVLTEVVNTIKGYKDSFVTTGGGLVYLFSGKGRKGIFPESFTTALKLSVKEHTDVLIACQKYNDSSCSKTVNIPSDYPFEDFKDLYLYAWENGLKGLATYRPSEVRGSVLSTNAPSEKATEPAPEEKKETAEVKEIVTMVSRVGNSIMVDIDEVTSDEEADSTLPVTSPATPEVDEVKSQKLKLVRELKPSQEDTLRHAKDRFDSFCFSRIDKRPSGFYPAQNGKFKYYNQAGEQTIYIGVTAMVKSFLVEQDEGTFAFKHERPFEIFLESNTLGEQDWLVHLGRSWSLVARESIKALSDQLKMSREFKGRNVVIRFGDIQKPDGGKAPLYHHSDIAVLAYNVQSYLRDIGVFDNEFNPISFESILSQYKPVPREFHLDFGLSLSKHDTATNTEPESKLVQLNQEAERQEELTEGKPMITGRTCKECGAPSVIKKDGCDFCTSCGMIGSCG